jgi:hypothetical protein
VRLEIDAIEHKLATEIEGIFCVRQTCLRVKKYMVKYKGYHHKEVVWMKLVHLDHFPKMVKQIQIGKRSRVWSEKD